MGIRLIIVECVRNAKSQFSSKQGILATQPSDWNELRANYLARLEFLSCSAPAIVTLQLPYMLHTCATLATCQSQVSREIQLRDSFDCTHLEFSSHSLTNNSYITPT